VNRIRVRPLEEDVDSGLRERVRKALADDPYLEGRQIDAVAVDGTIYLHGVVESFFEKAQAEDAVASVKGVRAVKNNITVHDLTVNYDPYVDGDYVYEIGPMGPTDLEPAFLSDTQIKENVVEQFYWSPYVDLEQIRITVEDAVVTLTGDVDSWKERVFARQEAYEAGAANVIDRLDVEKSGN
jgi:osmotically-inducible protein OsmY